MPYESILLVVLCLKGCEAANASVWCFFDLRSSIPEVPAVRLSELPTYTGSPTGASAQKLPTYSWVVG